MHVVQKTCSPSFCEGGNAISVQLFIFPKYVLDEYRLCDCGYKQFLVTHFGSIDQVLIPVEVKSMQLGFNVKIKVWPIEKRLIEHVVIRFLKLVINDLLL